jgi:hypothetical protein
VLDVATSDPLFPNSIDGWLRLGLGLSAACSIVMGLVYKLYILPNEKEFKRIKDEVLPEFREAQKTQLDGLGARVSKSDERITRVEERVGVVERSMDEIRSRMNGMAETLGEIKASTAAGAKASVDTQIMIARFDERLTARERREEVRR